MATRENMVRWLLKNDPGTAEWLNGAAIPLPYSCALVRDICFGGDNAALRKDLDRVAKASRISLNKNRREALADELRARQRCPVTGWLK